MMHLNATANRLRALTFTTWSRHTRRTASTYVWGNADHGQLGLPTGTPSVVSESDTFGTLCANPTEVDRFHNVRLETAAISSSHTAFIRRSDGALFTCGHNVHGQLGLGSGDDDNGEPVSTSIDYPNQVQGLPPVISVACGARHTLAVTHDGLVFSFGCNKYGQLGLSDSHHHSDETNPMKTKPQLVRSLAEDGRRIVAVAAGDDFSVALSDTGRVFTWGAAHYGALGHEDVNNNSTASTTGMSFFQRFTSGSSVSDFDDNPRLVRALMSQKITAIYSGRRHVMAIERGGKIVYAWGHGRHFLLGTESETDEALPVRTLHGLNGKTIKKLAVGNNHLIILTTDGAVYTLGENEHGCLGLGERQMFLQVCSTPTRILELGGLARDIAAGWNVSAAVLADGTVKMWGCGKAGALAKGLQENNVDYWAPSDIGESDGDGHVKTKISKASRIFVGSGGNSVIMTAD